MTSVIEQGLAARQLLKEQSLGVLSTHSVEVEGYPFGSITPYTLNHEGEPILLISNIAQHTRNIQYNRKVSLIVFDAGSDDPLAGGRLTWLGDAEPVPPTDTEARRRYLRYFPSAESYMQMHDFGLYRIKFKRARYIGGFGEIYWLERETMVVPNPLREVEEGIVEHMNEDHGDVLLDYCQVLKAVVTEKVRMVGIDHEGFDLLAEKRRVRFEFESPISSAEEARERLITLSRLSKKLKN